MNTSKLPFSSLAQSVLESLAGGRCVSILGLSNMGKSTFMRSLAGEEAQGLYAKARSRSGYLIYVDCNRAVDISPQAFYEVVLRSILERLGD
jgi:alpha-D-ribose 1-methylphosphonate 5-triphosphate synthase subunit PhnL